MGFRFLITCTGAKSRELFDDLSFGVAENRFCG